MADPYTKYYLEQAGHGLPVFSGARTQRGHGLGNIFGGLAKMVLPLVKSALPTIKRQAAKTGMRIASDVLRGKSPKNAVKDRALEAGNEMLQRVIDRPINTKAKRKRVSSSRRKPPNKRLKKRDIFD